ncbi:MAG: tRNA 2-thiouridine(34) synthase MnmA [Clostridia bacterium]
MNKKKIAVGMSGGVDSSVAALMLKQQGHDVIGITLLLKPTANKEEEDAMFKEVNDAKAVCEKIGIEHHTADFRKEFNQTIIKNFVDEYKNGRTPNPCILCNSVIKFGKMLDFAKDLGYDYLATGHYAIIEEKEGEFFLRRSENPKDQSYFLYLLTQEQLSHVLFPLEKMEKSETREIAEKFELPVAKKSDSQDICFIKNGDYISFIDKRLDKPFEIGDFVDENGKVLGKHKGIYRYTVGQRRGLGIALGERCFVGNIDVTTNNITLLRADSKKERKFIVGNPHFINIEKLENEIEVMAKTRYRAKLEKAIIRPLGDDVELEFLSYETLVSPGQSAVFYIDDTVVGGGILKK